MNSLGGFYRSKEEFNGDDAVLSYLNDKGENHETYNISTSNFVYCPKHVRTCADPDAHLETHIETGKDGARAITMNYSRSFSTESTRSGHSDLNEHTRQPRV